MKQTVFLRWDMHADSWTGTRTLLSVHASKEGAEAAMPESIRKPELQRDLYDKYVVNYTYEAVEEVVIQP